MFPVELDVTNRESIKVAVTAVVERFGQIDVLLNNAGYGLNGPLEGASNAQMRRQFDVNVFGLIDVTKAVLPAMRARRDGLILNVSSIGGLIGMPISPLYIATKHAVEGLTESMRLELQPFGIRVKLIEPGGIKTDFIARSSDWTDHPDYADHIQAAKAMTDALNDSLANPADVAKVIFRAATDPSERLRYLARPGPYVSLYRLLPDALWRSMIQAALRRQARSTGSARAR
ncbi:MAG: SDR family oxidoreductase [Pseudomonadota bacterium]